jgi:ribosome assembly protein YihI (activator of Der GTPase)
MNQWSQIEWLVDGEGEITIGRMGGIPCAAVAADGHNALAMLVRRRRESLDDLLTRLDDAIRLAVEEDTYTDEING